MITEMFSSIMGEGKYIGRRYIFIRFPRCNLNCVYCDEKKNYKNRVEVEPGSGVFEEREIRDVKDIVKEVERLKTDDLFAISFTGGEPLLFDKLDELNKLLKKKGFRTHLESNGTLPERLVFTDIGSIDIKLKGHIPNYKEVYNKELESIKILYENGVDVYAKVVILSSNTVEEIEKVAKDLSEIGSIFLCLQPVTPTKYLKGVSKKVIFKMMEKAGKYVDVMTTIQMHKYMKIL
ncbi:7-carboxy-7-deazaguanine synthase QueE [Methanocaldococcus infernus]